LNNPVCRLSSTLAAYSFNQHFFAALHDQSFDLAQVFYLIGRYESETIIDG